MERKPINFVIVTLLMLVAGLFTAMAIFEEDNGIFIRLLFICVAVGAHTYNWAMWMGNDIGEKGSKRMFVPSMGEYIALSCVVSFIAAIIPVLMHLNGEAYEKLIGAYVLLFIGFFYFIWVLMTEGPASYKKNL